MPRISGHTTTLLPNGKILVAGGYFTNGSLASAELFDPAKGTWETTGDMNVPRDSHAATLLPNGKVLVAGGNNVAYNLSSAELYDPATRTWTMAGSMTTARANFTATLLANGKVLAAGGGFLGSADDRSSAELYDPATGTWTATGSMFTARKLHTATLLPSGRVLVAGGQNGALYLTSLELFNPATGTWTTNKPMAFRRTHHTATLMPNGKVLIAGGYGIAITGGTYASLASAEIFNPTNGALIQTTMIKGHENHTATLLPSGKVLVVAGLNGYSTDISSGAELFDPAAETWTATCAITNKSHTATLLPDGRVLVAGGYYYDFADNAYHYPTPALYDSSVGTWTNANASVPIGGGNAASLLPDGKALVGTGFGAALYDPVNETWATATNGIREERYDATATLLPDGNVLVPGGWDGMIVSKTADLFVASNKIWMAVGNLTSARYQHSATLLSNGKVLVAGGWNDDSFPDALSSVELYHPATRTWSQTGSLNVGRRMHTATLLPNGKVLVTGGQGVNFASLSSAELYDPITGTWTMTSGLRGSKNRHKAILLSNGKVLVESELYDPATETWTDTGSMNFGRTEYCATLLPNGKVLVSGGYDGSLPYPSNFLSSAELYDPTTGMWAVTGSQNSPRTLQTTTLLPNGKVLCSGGVALGNPVAELYDIGLAFNASWQPQITTFNSSLGLGGSLTLTGSQFRGISGGSGGNSLDSPANHPVVQLRSIESGQTMFLLSTNWSTNSFTSLPVWNFPPGFALVTVFVNGIHGTSGVVNVSVPVPTTPTLTDAKNLADGSFQFAFTNNVGALFGVLATTNAALPLSSWTALGGVTEVSPGQFQFTDPQATNSQQRFYQIRSP
ncbi:MAG TPA: kelch repeat-containing protein [Candidatus Paceibacterota bacterium]|nr:kelch repeat-containing protein [Candidatus Paceibacterota bacterium]